MTKILRRFQFILLTLLTAVEVGVDLYNLFLVDDCAAIYIQKLGDLLMIGSQTMKYRAIATNCTQAIKYALNRENLPLTFGIIPKP